MRTVREIVLKVLQRGNEETITEMTPLDVDSIEFVELVIELEQEFDIEFADFDLNIQSFQRIHDFELYVENRVKDKQ